MAGVLPGPRMAVVGTPLRALTAVALLPSMTLRTGSTAVRPLRVAMSGVRGLVGRRGQMYRGFVRRMRRLGMRHRVRLMRHRVRLMRHRVRLMCYRM
jgi:hypothetical protein